MPGHATVSAAVRVRASPERAFTELIDVAGQGRWMLATRIYPVEGPVPSPRVGSRLVAVTGLAGVGVLDTMEVTELEPASRWVVAHQGRLIRGSGVFTVEPVPGGGCTVRWIEDLDLPFGILGRVGFRLLRPAVRWGLQRSLRRLAAILEAG